jgi:polyhydroxybutyrate depolymerase
MPLLILAHGYGVNGTAQDFLFPFSKQVDAKQFRYALPHGTQDGNGKRFWNATDACCDFGPLTIDDVAFFRAVVEKAKSEFAVTKVFLVGHSNGAFMSLRLACEAGDVFDGVVAVSGSTWNDATRCPDGRAVPILLVHGTADDTIPYEGKEGLYPSARATAENAPSAARLASVRSCTTCLRMASAMGPRVAGGAITCTRAPPGRVAASRGCSRLTP